MCDSGYIFQAKVDEILSDIEVVKTYTNYIFVLSKEILYKHIYQIMVILSRLHTVGIQYNTPKCSLG